VKGHHLGVLIGLACIGLPILAGVWWALSKG
jgi:hypothetical protein